MKRSQALADMLIALGSFAGGATLAVLVAAAAPAAWRIPLVVVSQGLWLLVTVAALLAWRRQPWRHIGMRPPEWRDGPRSLAAFAACLGVNLLFLNLVRMWFPGAIEAHSEQLGYITRQFTLGLPWPLVVLVLAFVGVYEEIFARGLLLDRCRVLLRSRWPAVLVASTLFGLGHFYQGWIGVGQTTLMGVVLAVTVIRCGTLWPAIAAHALLDIFSVGLAGGG